MAIGHASMRWMALILFVMVTIMTIAQSADVVELDTATAGASAHRTPSPPPTSAHGRWFLCGRTTAATDVHRQETWAERLLPRLEVPPWCVRVFAPTQPPVGRPVLLRCRGRQPKEAEQRWRCGPRMRHALQQVVRQGARVLPAR